MLLRYVIGAALACALGTSLPAADQSAGSASGATAGQSTLGTADLAFVVKAAQSGLFEVESATLAQSKQLGPEHQRIVQMILTDHSAANEELKSLAQSKGVTLATTLDETYRDKLDGLRKLEGEEFAKQFEKVQIQAHKDSIEDFRQATTEVKDPELRAWAVKTLPVLEQHQMHLKGTKAKDDHGSSHGMEGSGSSSRTF